MREKIKHLLIEIDSFTTNSVEELESFRIKMLGKKGEVTILFDDFKGVELSIKKEIGQLLNELKTKTQQKISDLKELTESSREVNKKLADLTLPSQSVSIGSRHPLSLVKNEIIDIFSRIGFTVSDGPEIEDDWHNFSALNFPDEHPARDMQDTFFIDDPRGDIMLRSHTSPVQIRMMKHHAPPIRSIMPGRVYRNEAITARSLAEFHQIEGLYIDKGVTFADLKGTVISFAKQMYGEHSIFKFRPSYFPFTEPSAEVDITCYLCSGKGCRVCKHSGWLEICGCGMVHPNVLKNCGIDPEIYSGFAFGFGIERVTMLATGIDDIRALYENDMRILKQF